MSAGQLLASADRRLHSLEKLRDKVALLESQQDALEDWQSAQREVRGAPACSCGEANQQQTSSECSSIL
jgi:hypothetical protein